MRYINIEMRE